MVDAGTEQPILEQVRTTGMVDHRGVISSTAGRFDRSDREVREYPRLGRGPVRKRDVLRGGRRVAPLVSTEYSINVSRRERSRKGGSPRSGRKSDRKRGYGLMMTRAPMSTWAYNASESAMYIRMQPCEAYVPIDDELYVPWMRIPGALR